MKNLKNLGKALNKAEQKEINGGRAGFNETGLCQSARDCFYRAGGWGSIDDYACINGHCALAGPWD